MPAANHAPAGLPLRAAIVDDEPAARALLVEMLEPMAAIQVVGVCADIDEVIDLLVGTPVDVLFIDIRLSRGTGFDLVDRLAARLPMLPALIFVTAYEEHARQAFDVGATDYVMKPLDPRRLRTAVERVVTRLRTGPVVRFADVEVDLSAHVVRRAGHPVLLRPLEFRLLATLLGRAGRVVRRDTLMREVWGYDPDIATRTLDIHVKNLRQKLEPDPSSPRHIVTVRTVGYRVDL